MCSMGKGHSGGLLSGSGSVVSLTGGATTLSTFSGSPVSLSGTPSANRV